MIAFSSEYWLYWNLIHLYIVLWKEALNDLDQADWTEEMANQISTPARPNLLILCTAMTHCIIDTPYSGRISQWV